MLPNSPAVSEKVNDTVIDEIWPSKPAEFKVKNVRDDCIKV